MSKLKYRIKLFWKKIINALHEEHHGYINIKPSNKKEHFPKIQYVASENDLYDVSDEVLKKQTDEITRLAKETNIVISEMPHELGKALKYLREPLKTPVEHLERQIYL